MEKDTMGSLMGQYRPLSMAYAYRTLKPQRQRRGWREAFSTFTTWGQLLSCFLAAFGPYLVIQDTNVPHNKDGSQGGPIRLPFPPSTGRQAGTRSLPFTALVPTIWALVELISPLSKQIPSQGPKAFQTWSLWGFHAAIQSSIIPHAPAYFSLKALYSL